MKLAFDSYQGRSRIKVKYLNPYRSRAPGATTPDPDQQQAIRDRLSAKLRDLANRTPTPDQSLADEGDQGELGPPEEGGDNIPF